MSLRQLSFNTLLVSGLAGCTAQIETGALAVAGVAPQLDAAPIANGRAVDVYSLVARGALNCWFGSQGPFRATHIFHADVPSRAETSEIIVYERDPAQDNPRSRRAFRITLTETGDGKTLVGAENISFDVKIGEAMQRDALSWAKGGAGCETVVVAGAPLPEPAKPDARPKKPAPGARRT